MKKKLNRYTGYYTYKKNSITSDISSNKYPVIEKTNNGLLFPLGPKNNVDMKDMKD